MSSTVATRAPRFTPPAAPPARPRPGVAPSGRAPRWSAAPTGPCCGSSPTTSRHRSSSRARRVDPGLPSVVEPASAASGVETQLRRIDLDDFFAAEYDGDEVSVEIARPRPSSLRLTRREAAWSCSAPSLAPFSASPSWPPPARWPTTSPSRPGSSRSSPEAKKSSRSTWRSWVSTPLAALAGSTTEGNQGLFTAGLRRRCGPSATIRSIGPVGRGRPGTHPDPRVRRRGVGLARRRRRRGRTAGSQGGGGAAHLWEPRGVPSLF